MTILEVCEPLFKKVCLLNRLGRKGGGTSDYDRLRLEIEEMFKEMERVAGNEPFLRSQWQKLEFPLIFFVDSMIAESGLPVAAQWHQHRLAYDRKELAGDEKFFDFLDETAPGTPRTIKPVFFPAATRGERAKLAANSDRTSGCCSVERARRGRL